MTKRILDEETRKKLLGYVPFSSDCRIPFMPEAFKKIDDESLRPVFEVRSLSQAEMTQLKQNQSQFSVDSTSLQILAIAEKNINLVCSCVLGWKNLFDAGTGEEVVYVNTKAGDLSGGCEGKLFESLPPWLKRSILEFVKKISGLSEPEEFSIK